MSINQAVASRQSNIIRQVSQGGEPGKLLTVKSYTVAEADALITGAQSSVKKARAFLRFLSEKRADGWRLDPFHKQLKELCHQTLHDHAARRAQAAQRRDANRTQEVQEFYSTVEVTPLAAATRAEALNATAAELQMRSATIH
jgi:hypothetical protein